MASTVYKKVAEDLASELNKSKEEYKKVSAKLWHQELRKVNVQNSPLERTVTVKEDYFEAVYFKDFKPRKVKAKKVKGGITFENETSRGDH